MLFTAYEALLSPHVRSDERTDAAVCLLMENSVGARASYIIPPGLPSRWFLSQKSKSLDENAIL